MTTAPRRRTTRRPAPTVELTVRMPKPMAERLHELAAARDTATATVVRRLVLSELVRVYGGDVDLGLTDLARHERIGPRP